MRYDKNFNLIEIGNESYFSIDIVDRENPIFQELNFRNIDSILPQIFKFVNVFKDENHKTVLSIDNGSPFLLEIPILGSQIYFFTSMLDLRWNDFGMKGLLIPMMYRLLMFSVISYIPLPFVEKTKSSIRFFTIYIYYN